MAKFFRQLAAATAGDLRTQFFCPVKSPIGRIFTKKLAALNKDLVRTVVNELDLRHDSKVLEIGYGHGEGLAACLERVTEPSHIFGIELSDAMEKEASDRFFEEIHDDKMISLDRWPSHFNLPYPTYFFDAIFHVDVFYFWSGSMRLTLKEIQRILRPGGVLMCGMELNRLEKLEKWGVVRACDYDPMSYMVHLEPAGFTDVQLTYHKLSETREVQLIRAKKPSESEVDYSPDAALGRLEQEVKQHLAMESLIQSRIRNAQVIKEAVKEQKNNESEAETTKSQGN